MVSKKQKIIAPVGYGIRADPGDLGGEFCEPFLLPIWLLEQLEVEALERERLVLEEVEHRRAEANAAYKAKQKAEDEERSNLPPPSGSSTRIQTPLQAAQALTVPGELPPAPPGTVAVFDWDAARDRFESLKKHPATADKEIIARDLRHFAKAMANGPWRTVARAATWREDLGQLAAEMPNFAAVVDAIQRAMALADLSGRPAILQPILLLGAPGVGKTHFTQRLAEVLHAPIHRQSFDNAQSNTLLRGSERHWSNSSVGALWELIVLGEKANPVVLLDEIDKGANEGSHHRPVDALLSLLEPVTASKVKDVSVDFEFNASHVVYMATANDAGRIAAPVRSRFLEFFIEEPDIDGRLVLAHSIFQATLHRLVPTEEVRATFARPTDLQICCLAWMTPRQIRMASERALGAAAYEGRRRFEDRDFDAPKPRPQVAATSRRPKDDGGDEFAVFVVRS
ncbi:AAA family ATPase [Variovorax sp. J31P179]|uniref:AAA family ATPase n=1 Tax=Variovorax sp. J31P179 TaxID=3053508 RepID=UPI00257606D7|nr:AAA family ATPase [Variovorax sp. J31P179]MDM0084695.1 AAA family ATPase [Variovorax sp. J31P179]